MLVCKEPKILIICSNRMCFLAKKCVVSFGKKNADLQFGRGLTVGIPFNRYTMGIVYPYEYQKDTK